MKTFIYSLIVGASLAIVAVVSFPTPATSKCIRCAGKLFCGQTMPIGCNVNIKKDQCCKQFGTWHCPCPPKS